MNTALLSTGLFNVLMQHPLSWYDGTLWLLFIYCDPEPTQASVTAYYGGSRTIYVTSGGVPI